MKISVIVPIYNEVANLRPLQEQLRAALADLDHEVILVNDGSSDGSDQALDDLAAEDDRFKIVHLRRNYGQTAAIMAAIEMSSGDILIPIDGDLQNDPADIPLLLDKLAEGYDVVSGWRRDRQDAKVTRTFPSRVANWLISAISGVRLHDYGCTLKAYRRGVLEGVRLYGEMHRFIPIYASWAGGKVTEIAVRHHPRRHGESKYGLSRIPRVILDLIVIRFLDTALDRPMQFFGRFGLYSIGLSFLAGLWALWLKFFDDTSFIQTPLPLLVVLLFLIGVLCILLGLLAELQTRVYFESRGKPPYVVRDTRNL